MSTEARPTDDQWKAFFRGESTDEEYAWMKSLLDKEEVDKTLEKLFDPETSDTEDLALNMDREAMFKGVENKLGSQKSLKVIFRPWMAVAASLVLFMGFWGGYQLFFTQNLFMYSSANMEIKKVTLPDGSLVTLNANSSFDYAEASGMRKVNLIGEAFFDVARDESKPFVITTRDARVEVLGTSFNVKAYTRQESIVSVQSGKVQVTDEDQKVILVKGEEAVRTVDDLQKKATFASRTVWMNKKLIYDGALLKAIFNDLEAWYGIEIQASEEINGISYTATVSLEKDLTDFLINLQISENIDFSIVNGQVRLVKN